MGLLTKIDISILATSMPKVRAHIAGMKQYATMREFHYGCEFGAIRQRIAWLEFVIGDRETDPRG